MTDGNKKGGETMNETAREIQKIINTLQALNITATEDNMRKLLACLEHLAEIRDALTPKENAASAQD